MQPGSVFALHRMPCPLGRDYPIQAAPNGEFIPFLHQVLSSTSCRCVLGVWELANWILSTDAAEEGGFMRLSSKMEGLVDRLMQRMTMALLAQVLRTIYTRMGISNAQQRSLIRRLQVSISRLEHPPQQPHSDPGTHMQFDTFPSWSYNSASQETRNQEPRRGRVSKCRSESTTLSVCTLLAPQSLYEFSFCVHQDEHGRDSFTMSSFFQVAQTSGTRDSSDFSHSCGHSGRSGSSCRTLKSKVFFAAENAVTVQGGALCKVKTHAAVARVRSPDYLYST